jgi:hypothetical protein
VFKDCSSGLGGSIFDFVRMKEKLGSLSQALSFVRRLLGGSPYQVKQSESTSDSPDNTASSDRPYDVAALYERFRQEDPEVRRRYLLSRGIAGDLCQRPLRRIAQRNKECVG